MFVYLNGAFVEERDAVVSVFDRGFLYGDTVYETIRAVRGRVLFWEEHRRRLRRSCELAAFDIDWAAIDLRAAVDALLARNDLADARLRITVSRGIGDPDQLDGFQPTWVISARAFQPVAEALYDDGVAVVVVGVTRNAVSSLNPEMKSGNFLNNLLARREARLRGAFEGIMISPDGYVAEGSMSNLFWVREGTLETPALDVGILPGVTRAKLLEAAGAGGLVGVHEVREVRVAPDVVRAASEVFLTSTSLEALPVREWDGRPIGSRGGGPVAKELRRRLQAMYEE